MEPSVLALDALETLSISFLPDGASLVEESMVLPLTLSPV